MMIRTVTIIRLAPPLYRARAAQAARIVRRRGNGGKTRQAPSSCRKKQSAMSPPGPRASTWTQRPCDALRSARIRNGTACLGISQRSTISRNDISTGSIHVSMQSGIPIPPRVDACAYRAICKPSASTLTQPSFRTPGAGAHANAVRRSSNCRGNGKGRNAKRRALTHAQPVWRPISDINDVLNRSTEHARYCH